MGGRPVPLPVKRSPSPSPALGSPRVSSGIIDLTLDDTTPPPTSTLGKRGAPPVDYNETYVDDDGTVHPPSDHQPKKRARTRAHSRTPKTRVKGKGKARDTKSKPILPLARTVQPPPLPEPHQARLSALTTALPQGIVSPLLFVLNQCFLTDFYFCEILIVTSLLFRAPNVPRVPKRSATSRRGASPVSLVLGTRRGDALLAKTMKTAFASAAVSMATPVPAMPVSRSAMIYSVLLT